MSTKPKSRMSRRQFLRLIAAAGGTGAAYMTMRALGVLAEGSSSPPRLSGKVKGKRIIILGAGLAGMSAAYELEKAGYVCELIEARERVGGRCWTVRDGSRRQELDGRQKIAHFDEGLYFNPGPARIPQHHFSTLHYCKEFGLEIELFANSNQAAYVYQASRGRLSGQALRIRKAKADLRGYQSELLAKAIFSEALRARGQSIKLKVKNFLLRRIRAFARFR